MAKKLLATSVEGVFLDDQDVYVLEDGTLVNHQGNLVGAPIVAPPGTRERELAQAEQRRLLAEQEAAAKAEAEQAEKDAAKAKAQAEKGKG